MAYANITFAQAKVQLAQLLQDTANVFWTDLELGVYIVEALRTWGAFSFYWKETGVFNSTDAIAFYDLPTVLPALRGYTVTDTDLVEVIQYSLLEPATGTSWTGTDMFSLSDVTNALERRRNQFLVETGCRVDNFQSNVAPVQIGRTVLADDVIDVRRVAWFDGADYTMAKREDEWSITAYSPLWTQDAATPSLYSVSVTPPLTIQLAPPPLAAGQLDILAVRSQANLDPAATVSMNMPDDFCWAVKFGALADLLGSDGQARDPQRAAYCEQRWREGIAMARLSTSVMTARVNDVPCALVSQYELDEFSTDWQNSSTQPSMVAMSGLNMLALGGVPDATPYSITLDVVRNSIVPTADGDFLQIGREDFEAVLSYAQHLAAFKMGGAEFEMTIPGYQRFMQQAALKNERLLANARDFEALYDKGQRRFNAAHPRREELVA